MNESTVHKLVKEKKILDQWDQFENTFRYLAAFKLNEKEPTSYAI